MNNIHTASAPLPEPDPDFKFVRPLPKKSAAYTNTDAEIEAQVSSHKAIVHWYKGDEKLEVSRDTRETLLYVEL